MYQPSLYSLKKAKSLKVEIKPSNQKNKKLDVFRNNIYKCSIGDIRYSDYPTYINSHGLLYANQRRNLYKKRHENDRKVHGTAGYYADQILW